MPKKAKSEPIVSKPSVEPTSELTVSHTDLATALIAAINAAKPVEKKNPFNRIRNNPNPFRIAKSVI